MALLTMTYDDTATTMMMAEVCKQMWPEQHLHSTSRTSAHCVHLSRVSFVWVA